MCFTNHKPKGIYDDLDKGANKLGSNMKYCLQAIHPIGYKFGYRSDPACSTVKIEWEAMVCMCDVTLELLL
jgi:hypothetical protein